jgi:hypothetical protein
MVSKYQPKKLIVEGDQDKRVIPELIEANGISWGETKEKSIVYIESSGSDGFINEEIIFTELKILELIPDPNYKALGLIIDADDDLAGRWQSVRNACLKSMPDIPEKIPETGLIHHLKTGINFGVWIMPDNKMRGMLETFLAYLIPDESDLLWNYAQEVVEASKHKGASFIDMLIKRKFIHG